MVWNRRARARSRPKLLLEFLVRGRADAADLTTLERGFEQVRGVHRAAGGRTRADNRMDLVDEEDGVRDLLQPPHDGLQAFSKSSR